MALALSPQSTTANRRHVTAPDVAAPRSTQGATGLRLSADCRARRNREVLARYEARRREIQRRRRVVVLLLVTFAAAACLGVRVLASRGDGSASLPTVTPVAALGASDPATDLSGALVRDGRVYVVQPGDTLWSIASSLTEGSISNYVEALIELNGSASIDVGQRLILPAT